MIRNVFKPKRYRDGKLHIARTYSGRYRVPGQSRVTTVALKTPDKQVAEERLRKIVNEIEREGEGLTPSRELRDASQKPLVEHLAEFLAAKAATRRNARYLYELKNRVLKLLKECRWTHAKDVSPEGFVSWRNRSKCSDKTLNEYLTSARGLLNWMVAKGRLPYNPLKGVETPSTKDVQVRPRRAFSEDELKRLLALAARHRIVYQTAALTGLRRSELAKLERADVRLDGERPQIVARAATTKNKKQATIPLHRELVEALRVHLTSLAGGAEALVFADIMPAMDQFRADLKAAGIPFLDDTGRRADFHSLRHTFCTNLQRAGVLQRDLMELMRHSDRSLSDRVYTDSSLLATDEAVQKLNGFGNGDAHIDTQRLDAARLQSSSPVTINGEFQVAQAVHGEAIGHGSALNVAMCHESGENARYRVRTCDPYRVKVVLYH